MLRELAGREDVRERMKLAEAKGDEVLDPMEMRTLVTALKAHELGLIWPDGFAGINSILGRLFQKTSGEQRLFEKHFDTPGKAFVRVKAQEAGELFESIGRVGGVKSLQVQFPSIESMTPKFFHELIEYAQKLQVEGETTLYAMSDPDAPGSRGDIFVFNLAKIFYNELLLLGHALEGSTTFYAQGPSSGDAIAFLKDLNPSEAIKKAKKKGGRGGSGGGGTAGGTDPSAEGSQPPPGIVGMGAASAYDASAMEFVGAPSFEDAFLQDPFAASTPLSAAALNAAVMSPILSTL